MTSSNVAGGTLATDTPFWRSALAARESRPWRVADFGLLGLMLAVATWVNRDAFADIWKQATTDVEQGHILLVPFVAVFMIWVRRQRLEYLRYQPSLLGPALIATALGIRWWGIETDTLIAWHFAALLSLLGCITSMAGWEFVRQMRAAIVACLFILPVPGIIRQQIAIPLQSVAATVTTGTLDLLGFKVIQQGSVIIFNGVPVAVGEACNGMRMILALALVVFAFVFSVPFRTSTRMFLLALSPLIALLCNVLRLIPTALVYGYGTPSSAERFHDIAGWVMLPVALAMMLGIVRLLQWLDLPVMNWRLTKS